MKKIFALLILFCSTNLMTSDIIIRPAIINDLEALFTIDKEISYEYYIPVFNAGYSHLPLGQNPTYYLDLEMKDDYQLFLDCINNVAPQSLWVAYDQQKQTVVGFLMVLQTTPMTLFIDLIMVLKEYRNLGIGKRLLQEAIAAFPDTTICYTYTLYSANESTLQFFKNFGFVNHGRIVTDEIDPWSNIPFNQLYDYLTYEIK